MDARHTENECAISKKSLSSVPVRRHCIRISKNNTVFSVEKYHKSCHVDYLKDDQYVGHYKFITAHKVLSVRF